MPIGGDLFRTLPRDGLRTLEGALGRGPIALGTEHRINQLPLFVNGSIPIHPAATHLYLGFIHLPTAADSALPPATNLVGQQGSESCFPVSYRFVAQLITTNQKHRHEITSAEFEQQAEQHHLKHNVGRPLEKLEQSARALIELTTTTLTARDHRAEIRSLRECSGLGRLTVRTLHPFASP